MQGDSTFMLVHSSALNVSDKEGKRPTSAKKRGGFSIFNGQEVRAFKGQEKNMGNRAKIHDLGHYAHTITHDSYIAMQPPLGSDPTLTVLDEALVLDGAQAFARVCAKLKAQIGADAYASWFGRLKLVELTRHQVCLSVPTAFLRSWINNHYFQ